MPTASFSWRRAPFWSRGHPRRIVELRQPLCPVLHPAIQRLLGDEASINNMGEPAWLSWSRQAACPIKIRCCGQQATVYCQNGSGGGQIQRLSPALGAGFRGRAEGIIFCMDYSKAKLTSGLGPGLISPVRALFKLSRSASCSSGVCTCRWFSSSAKFAHVCLIKMRQKISPTRGTAPMTASRAMLNNHSGQHP